MRSMIKIWNKISKYSKDYNLNTYGIVLDTIENVIQLAEEKSIHFNLFAPKDIKKFKEQFKTRFNLSQTILCKNGKVIYIMDP